MDRTRRTRVGAGLAWLAFALVAHGQPGYLPPAPVPTVPVPPAQLGAPQPVPGYPPPPPPANVPYPPPGLYPPLTPPPPGPLLPADDFVPFRRLPEPLEFFAGLELQFLWPDLRTTFRGTVQASDGFVDTLAVPSAELDSTVAPKLFAGYRIPGDLGQFMLSYRLVASDGRGQVLEENFGQLADNRTRLNLNEIDLDYNSPWYFLGEGFQLRYTIGARVATVFYDSRLTNQFIDVRASNYTVGAGPHLALDLQRKFGILPSVTAFARLDTSGLVGPVQQKFSENVFDNSGNVVLTGFGEARQSRTFPTLAVVTGLQYTPPGLEELKLSAGYQFEHWWNVGKLNESRGDFQAHSLFLRGQFDF